MGVIAAALLLQAPAAFCEPQPTAPRLDHVVLVVNDLEAVSAAFARSGFRVKEGRLHPNGLINRHVKFRDGSGIELMSIAGAPGDPMASDYSELLREGEGAVYVALDVEAVGPIVRASEALDLESVHDQVGPWSFVRFPSNSPAATVFFMDGLAPVEDPEALVTHDPPVLGLTEVWTEGGEPLERLIDRLGGTDCGAAIGPAGEAGRRWALGGGTLVVVPSTKGRPRVLGAVLDGGADRREVVNVHPTFWLQYR